MMRDGAPVTPMRLIASTWNVTVWVAVCAEAVVAKAATSSPPRIFDESVMGGLSPFVGDRFRASSPVPSPAP